MYLPWLFNERQEFQRLGGLLAHDGYNSRVGSEVQEFLLRATGVRLALNRIAELKQDTERRFRRHRAQLHLDRDPVQCWSRFTVDLIGQITSSIGQLRSMQDLLLAILAKLQSLKDVPASLNGAVRDFGKYGFDPRVARVLTDYWNAGGLALKGYRDIDSHFFAIASHVVMYHSQGVALKVYLPDDPSQKSRHKTTFAGKVDAVEFLTGAYEELERAFDRCLELLGIKSQPIPLVFGIRPHEPLPLTAEATVAVNLATTSAIETRFDPVAQTLRSEVIELPPNDPADCPVPLFAIIDELRQKLKGAETVTAADLQYVGAPEVTASVRGFEVGGPRKGWLWRLDRGELSYFVLAFAEESGWIYWQRIRPGVDQNELLATLFRRAFMRRQHVPRG